MTLLNSIHVSYNNLEQVDYPLAGLGPHPKRLIYTDLNSAMISCRLIWTLLELSSLDEGIPLKHPSETCLLSVG